MLRFLFTAINPWFKTKNSKFISVYEWELYLTKNKIYEFEVCYYNRYFFGITLDMDWISKNHGGIELQLCLLGYSMNFKLYDKRHFEL